MSLDTEKRSTAQMSSVLRTFEILEKVAELQPVSLSRLVREFAYSKSTVQRTLTTLESAGWIYQSAPGVPKWQVSPRAAKVRPRVLRDTDLLERAQGPMTALMEKSGETIHLSLPSGRSNVVLIDRVDCDQAVRTFSPIGDVSPLHSTAIGKAVLAHFSPDHLDQIIAEGLAAYTPTTITNASQLRTELERIKGQGYSVNRREYRPAVSAIGAAVLDAEGNPIAGICISMPSSRFHEEDVVELGTLTSEAAKAITDQAVRSE